MIKKAEIKKKVSVKLQEVREDLHLSHVQLSAHLGVVRTTYTKSETGKTFPGFPALYTLSNTFDVSLDWLIANKGPKYFKEKMVEPMVASVSEPVKMESETPNAIVLDKDQQELFEQMNNIPLLKHEVMAFFLRFKENNPDLIARSQKRNPNPKE